MNTAKSAEETDEITALRLQEVEEKKVASNSQKVVSPKKDGSDAKSEDDLTETHSYMSETDEGELVEAVKRLDFYDKNLSNPVSNYSKC